MNANKSYRSCYETYQKSGRDMTRDDPADLTSLLGARYRDAPEVATQAPQPDLIRSMAARGSCRSFLDDTVPTALVDMLCAVALASPTKSDLQQRDIILIRDPSLRQSIAALVPGQDWIADAPNIAVFCGNNRRQRLLHDWHEVRFANDHLDAFFNAVGDAAIALGAFVTAAEAAGLGCCPISAVRNEAAVVSEMLALPDHVFPFAGLAFGYPARAPRVTKRLPLGVTCHVDRYSEENLQAQVSDYDRWRAETHPYRTQRATETFGHSDTYGWSEDKVRQYSLPEREDFGAYVKERGFKLD